MRCRLPGTIGLLAVCLTCLCVTPAQAQPRRYALVVGVKEYPASEKLDKLPYAETDAIRLAEVLEKTGYDVTLMTQTASKAEGGERFAPSATFLRREFATLVKTPFLQAEDCVLVTLAGHGIQLSSRTNPRQTAYYFCAADAQIDNLEFLEDVQPQHNLISVDEFFGVLKTCKAGVRLLVVDACRNDPTKPSAFRDAKSVTRPPVSEPPGGIAALFSCSANEKAVEDSTLQHGVFTHYLIEALSGQADTDKNGQLSIAEIETYVGFRTFDFVRKKYGRQQMPQLSGEIQGWAAVASLSPVKPAPLPTPMPMPSLDQFAGTKAGEVLTMGGIKFCWCPPGNFKMGSPESERDRDTNEAQVNVAISPGFWMGQYEVTQTEYETITGKNPSYFNPERMKSETGSHPVEQTNWEEAMDFCRKLTLQEQTAGRLPSGWIFTLPTEAQWEYACRAGSTTATGFGDTLGTTQANFDGTATYGAGKGIFRNRTTPIGSFPSNRWNLFDMHGNVNEWCQDWYANSLSGGMNPGGPQQGTVRVYRGGGWNNFGWLCRSACREREAPTVRGSFLGFRVALVPVTPGKPVSATPTPVPSPALKGFALGSKAGEVRIIGGIPFCWCPAGEFNMGSPDGPMEFDDNSNRVAVTLSQGFWLGQFEVTQGQWTAILKSTPWQGETQVKEGGNYPASVVTWDAAREFCEKLTAQGHQEEWLPKDWKFDLPTEAQWEYACRAGTETVYSFGDDAASLSEYAWWGGRYGDGNAKIEPYAHEVGLKKPNPWGFHDIHGNVMEWCRDMWAAELPGGTDPEVQEKSEYRACRGGNWSDPTSSLRTTHRNGHVPVLHSECMGFRLALVPAR